MRIDTNSLPPVESLLSPIRHSTQPWLTWYSISGERVELSGRVFDNWVAKSANLLSEEFDLDQESIVAIDMAGHWKSLALALACWHLGTEVRCIAPGQNPGKVDLVVTANPETLNAEKSVEVLVVPLPSLAMSFDGQLPVGATDFASEVRAYADSFFPSPIDVSGIALSTRESQLSFSELFVPANRASGTTLTSTIHSLEQLIPLVVGLWAQGDSVVLIEDGVAVTPRLLEGERIINTIE